MNAIGGNGSRCSVLAVLLTTTIWFACGDDDTGPEEGTGATLSGTVSSFDARVAGGGFTLASTEGVRVSIGSLSTETDAAGEFILRDIPLGDLQVEFSRDQLLGTYSLFDVDRGESFRLSGIQYDAGNLSSQHTGTWVGEGGSTDSTSVGLVALTMIIAQNGNSINGTASIGAPDNTSWNIIGTETGFSVSGEMTVTSTNSECASPGEFEGTFDADTLEGTFVEVHSDSLNALCGPPEPGVFRVVKQ